MDIGGILAVSGAAFVTGFSKSGMPGIGILIPLLAIAAGVLAGVLTMLANAAGPIMTVYLLSMDMDKNEFVGTSAWFYFIINLFKLPFSIALGLVTWETLKINLFLLPLVALGSFVGVIVMKKLPQKAFNIIAQILAVVGGVKLLF
jgi:uncharacterized membrane protein YfcA